MRLILTSVLVSLAFAAQAQEAPQLEQGQALVERMCAECHAVGASGNSRHPNAPPFRRLARTLEFGEFVARLREGLMVGHPDMPAFRFSRLDAAAVAAYLISIQSPGP